MTVNRRLILCVRLAAVMFVGVILASSSGCSDNPAGNPGRETISNPRNGGGEGGGDATKGSKGAVTPLKPEGAK
jgi:hypothetical protein